MRFSCTNSQSQRSAPSPYRLLGPESPRLPGAGGDPVFHTLVQELLTPTEKPPRTQDWRRQLDKVRGSSVTQKQVACSRLGGLWPPGPLLWAVGSGAGAQADEAQVAVRVPVGSVWPRPGELQVRRTPRRAPPSPDPPWTLGPQRGGQSAVLGTRRARPVPGSAETDSHHPVWWFPSFSGDVPRGNLKTE